MSFKGVEFAGFKMAYTVQQLITDAWYVSGVVSRGLETVTAEQLYDGLNRLNAVLDIATSNMGLIPYWAEYDFTAVIGQEIYFVPNLVQVETLTFNIQTVRYSIQEATREQYFAVSRVDNIQSLPYLWHLETKNGGGDVYLYFVPSQAFAMRLWGKFSLSNVALNTDLTLTYEGFYIEYLRYKLADYLCQYYNVMFPIVHQKTLASYEQSIRNVSPLDLSQQKLSIFQSGGPFNYGDVNIGKGWRPP